MGNHERGNGPSVSLNSGNVSVISLSTKILISGSRQLTVDYASEVFSVMMQLQSDVTATSL
jgi:hypothetical protein